MKALFAVSCIIAFLFLCGCNKDGGTNKSQTLSLLQNKWTLISSRLNFNDTSSLNVIYEGAPSDYYWFNTNDTLNIQQAGTVNAPYVPLSFTSYYSLINDSILFYGAQTGMEINIKTLTNNLLVLTNKATA